MQSYFTPEVTLYILVGLLAASVVQFTLITFLLRRNRIVQAAMIQFFIFEKMISEIFAQKIRSHIEKKRQEKIRREEELRAFYRDMRGGGTSSSPISDIRLKENISKIEDEHIQLKNIAPVKFSYVRENPYDLDTSFRFGFVAQEIEKVIPLATKYNSDGYLCIDYNSIVALLVKTVQELSCEVETLKAGNITNKDRSCE